MKPCPFCGEKEELEVMRVDDDNYDYIVVRCSNCGARGPEGNMGTTAMKYWDEREVTK